MSDKVNIIDTEHAHLIVHEDGGLMSGSYLEYDELRAVPWNERSSLIIPVGDDTEDRLMHEETVTVKQNSSVKVVETRVASGTLEMEEETPRRDTLVTARILSYRETPEQNNLRIDVWAGSEEAFHILKVDHGELVRNNFNPSEGFFAANIPSPDDCEELLRAVENRYQMETGETATNLWSQDENGVFVFRSGDRRATLISSGKRFEFTEIFENTEEGGPAYDWGESFWHTEDPNDFKQEPDEEHELTKAIVDFLK